MYVCVFIYGKSCFSVRICDNISVFVFSFVSVVWTWVYPSRRVHSDASPGLLPIKKRGGFCVTLFLDVDQVGFRETELSTA